MKNANTLPVWAAPVALTVCLVLVVFFAWRAIIGGQEAVGPSKEVHAGQYDFRAEIAKMRAHENQEHSK